MECIGDKMEMAMKTDSPSPRMRIGKGQKRTLEEAGTDVKHE